MICPECGHVQTADMPSDACQFFYECVNCKTVLRPQGEDCCVFCSYAHTRCPMKQGEPVETTLHRHPALDME